jgi:hypothetical protein
MAKVRKHGHTRGTNLHSTNVVSRLTFTTLLTTLVPLSVRPKCLLLRKIRVFLLAGRIGNHALAADVIVIDEM